MWLSQILDRNRVRFPTAIALRDLRRDVSWTGLHRDVSALAQAIANRIAHGDRVAVLSGNRVEYLETYFGCAAAGVTAVPINPSLTDPEIAHIMASVEPKLAVADAAGQTRLAAQYPDLPVLSLEGLSRLVAPERPTRNRVCDPTAPFAILHTSATTGRPKGVLVDQRSVQANALSWLGDVRPAPGTMFLTACPLFHGSVVAALHYLAAGAMVCVLDSFTPNSCLAALTGWRVEHAFLVPSMVRLLLQARGLGRADLSSLRLILHAAAPMPADLVEEATGVLGVPLQTIYGVTEAGGLVLTLRPDDRPSPPPLAGATCLGAPVLGAAVQVLREDGTRAEVGEVGEIHVAGDAVMRGYWKNPEATAEVLRDGWLNTRDLALVDTHGFLWMVDRRDDLILRGGQNVYPAEIEHILRMSPQVADVAVVPAPSTVWGQTPIAFVQPAGDEFDEAALVDLCVRQLASYKRPSRFIRTDQIPRNPSGKILRPVLRTLAARDGS
jgi:acyl-CoA synthetase (AMP-forming)/AMP-acid ligase II